MDQNEDDWRFNELKQAIFKVMSEDYTNETPMKFIGDLAMVMSDCAEFLENRVICGTAPTWKER